MLWDWFNISDTNKLFLKKTREIALGKFGNPIVGLLMRPLEGAGEHTLAIYTMERTANRTINTGKRNSNCYNNWQFSRTVRILRIIY